MPVLPDGGRVAVMAVINRTPDSFYDKGATFALDRAVEAALQARADGADWVDIGGVPFGRGPSVTVQEEIDRVVPVVEAIVAASDVIISVDTNSAEVARAAMVVCIMKGARIVRMHDVRPSVDAVRMTEAILGLREPLLAEHNTHPTHNV
ncbi:MAG: dihydropteroate synthase [Pseudolysinimonas sp.]